ncbi:MAG TPA: hypothetical protein VHE30_05500 [Polyangiaceae bacterium]|nr:hypothetical protein [Polyangiaceae bacterium]
MGRLAAAALALLSMGATVGCSGRALPDPRATVDEYAAAVRKGDSRAVYALLSEEARRAYGERGTDALVRDERVELASQARAVTAKGATLRIVAEVPFSDGERSIVEVEDGRFRVSAAAGLPSSPRTPAQALSDLRVALVRRSYAALVRVLAESTRASLERDLRSLASGLENPDALDVKVRGDTAEVVLAGGHKVRLVREAGVWRIFDFD